MLKRGRPTTVRCKSGRPACRVAGRPWRERRGTHRGYYGANVICMAPATPFVTVYDGTLEPESGALYTSMAEPFSDTYRLPAASSVIPVGNVLVATPKS